MSRLRRLLGRDRTADDGPRPPAGAEHLQRTYRGHRVYGWCRPEQGEWYASLVGDLKGGTVVEVGVYGGMSISYAADAAIAGGTTIHAVDPWERRFEEGTDDWVRLSGVHRDFAAFLDACDLRGHVVEVPEFSVEASRSFADGSIDLLYVDGGHTYDDVRADLEAWWPKVRPGGLVLGDDYKAFEGVARAADEFAAAHGLDLEVRHGTFLLERPTP